MFLVKLFEFVVGALVVLFLTLAFFFTAKYIDGFDLFQGTKDGLVFIAACAYFGIGCLVFVDFDK